MPRWRHHLRPRDIVAGPAQQGLYHQSSPDPRTPREALPFLPRKERNERAEAAATTTTMASGGMKRDISETHDTLRFGLNAGVKADLAPPHPLQSTIQSVRTPTSPSILFSVYGATPAPAQEAKFWTDKKKFGAEAIYGSAFNIRKDLDAQILSRFGFVYMVLPSS
ncbi:hypothetical protein HU200_017056 [Digitaria exilis]|uniref:Uncharacterized protein n=1 Tax=Digitaria exilis TaxID=1010633 RepID=A0A835F6Q4_9POAL|nr:hypothetical protein HU200_017056 [Digitaria exilis]